MPGDRNDGDPGPATGPAVVPAVAPVFVPAVAPVFVPAVAPVFVPHRRPGPMRRGRLVSRPNRFLGIVALDPAADGGGTDGGALEIEAHIGDRGRLVDILFPGAEVYVVPAAGPTRRTAYTLVCARCPPLEKGGQGPEIPPLCCLDPAFANRLVLALLQARALSGKGGLPEYGDIRPEVRVGASRFDFALALPATDGEGERRLLLEVKSAAAAKGRAAIFPDAPSLRAVRHTRELAALSRQGQKAAIVMLSQRADIAEIRPHPVDPLFAAALLDAQEAGVCLLGVAFEVRLDGFHYAGTRPVIPHIT